VWTLQLGRGAELARDTKVLRRFAKGADQKHESQSRLRHRNADIGAFHL